MSLRLGRSLYAVAAAALLSSCVDGGDPTAVELLESVRVAVSPVFAVEASTAEAGELSRARATIRNASDGALLGSVQEDIDPTANEWTLELSLELTSGQQLSVVLEAELAAVDGSGVESVEWSGRTSSFSVVAATEPQTIREVPLYRGPLQNLDVTDVVLSMSAASLLEGESAWLSADVQGGGEGTRVYFEALDPDVATVDGVGRVTAHKPGAARVVAIVGQASDELSFIVDEVVLPEPEDIQENVAPQMDYAAAEIVSTLGDAQGAAAISESLGDLGSALSGSDGAAAVSAFGAAAAAWASYGDPALRILDGPQLSLIEITLIHAADALGLPFG